MLRVSIKVKLAAITATALLGAGLAVTSAATPASAVTGEPFCGYNVNNDLYCAYAPDGTYVNMSQAHEPSWSWPNDGTHQISSATYGTCMAIQTGTNRIILEDCTGAPNEEWTAHNVDDLIAFSNTSTGTTLCLNNHWQVNQLDATTCNYSAPNPNELFEPN
jgi:hypothetical protein